MAFSVSHESVKAILLLDQDGKRVHAKYYGSSFPDKETQQKYEAKLYAKTKGTIARNEAEII